VTPPGFPVAGQDGRATQGGPAVLRFPDVLSKRADFVRASRALRASTPGFNLQARARDPREGVAGLRVGFTCSKKVGNAVARNRAKRRLREIARAILPLHGREGWDYVLIGKADVTAATDFTHMQNDLAEALARLHQAAP
jgi:ribonuclease P protein component